MDGLSPSSLSIYFLIILCRVTDEWWLSRAHITLGYNYSQLLILGGDARLTTIPFSKCIFSRKIIPRTLLPLFLNNYHRQLFYDPFRIYHKEESCFCKFLEHLQMNKGDGDGPNCSLGRVSSVDWIGSVGAVDLITCRQGERSCLVSPLISAGDVTAGIILKLVEIERSLSSRLSPGILINSWLSVVNWWFRRHLSSSQSHQTEQRVDSDCQEIWMRR